MQSAVAETGRQQKQEPPLTLPQETERGARSFSPFQPTQEHPTQDSIAHVLGGLPPSLKLLWKTLHRPIGRCVPMITLNTVKVTVKIKHHKQPREHAFKIGAHERHFRLK